MLGVDELVLGSAETEEVGDGEQHQNRDSAQGVAQFGVGLVVGQGHRHREEQQQYGDPPFDRPPRVEDGHRDGPHRHEPDEQHPRGQTPLHQFVHIVVIGAEQGCRQVFQGRAEGVELGRNPAPALVVVGSFGLHLFVQYEEVVEVFDKDALLQKQYFEFLVFARGAAFADIVTEPVVAESHSRADQRRRKAQRHVAAAENRIVDLFAGGVQHRRVAVAVLGRAVGLYGYDACVEDLVDAYGETPVHEVVGVEDRDDLRRIGTQPVHGGRQGFGLRTVFEGDFDHRQGKFAQFPERFGFQLVGDHHHAVQFRGIFLRERRLRRADDHCVGLVGGNQRHCTALFASRGINVFTPRHREGRKEE